jgi:hypothetical protein
MNSVLASALAGLVAMTALAAPAAAEGSYQKRRVVSFETSDPLLTAPRVGLQGVSRVEYLPLAALPNELIPGFVARVREASRAAGNRPTYVFVPSYSFGSVSYTEPRSEDTKHANGQIETVVSSEMQCPIYYSVDVFDAASGSKVHTLTRTSTMIRRYETRYDQRYSDRAVGYKEGLLVATLQNESRRAPRELFANQLRGEVSSTASWLANAITNLEEFKLYARVVNWDAGKDQVFADMGSDLGLGLEHGYTLMRGGEALGYMRAVQVKKGSSAFQPVFLDTTLQQGDKLVESSRSLVHLNLRTGMGWLTGPAVSGTIGFEPSIGTGFGLTDLTLPIEASLLGNTSYAGVQLELGVVKKHFFRRWGFSYGLKPGFLAVSGSGGFGATAVAGVHCYLLPGMVWSVETGFQGYRAYKAASSTAVPVNPFGPVLRTSLTF